ncbi:hypothetical protein GCM10009836_22990 [Pseudonocardia ailaonensis]|uniref:Bacterial transcriptional activator domain-containing protein n=1 Tax=Pseudonocardia ailaonensis TaxID=367279 RepID=A0ABN2MXG3_9PSEU
MPAQVRLQLLGRFAAVRAEAEIPPAAFGGRKVRALVRLLAVHSGTLVTHDTAVGALWPVRAPADPVANLTVLVNRARRAAGDDLVRTGSGGYVLGEVDTDIAELDAALRRARSAAEPAEALRAASAGLALWGDPLPEDRDADWAMACRGRLHRTRTELLDLAARSALRAGEPAEAVRAAAEAVALDPLHEVAAVLLARARAATGDRSGALAEVAALRARLADELGVEPGPEAAALHLELLRAGGPAVPAAPRPAAPPPALQSSRHPATLPFTGREAELAGLRRAVHRREVVVVAGPAGIGKSRLVGEALRGIGVPVLQARAFAAERAETWSLARTVLEEAVALDGGAAEALPERIREGLATVLPELAVPGVGLDAESRRALLLAGAVRVVGRVTGEGAVLVVDDLQWADPSSVVLLGSVLARVPALAVVLACRPDETDPAVLDGVTAGRTVRRLVPGPLTAAELTAATAAPELAGTLVAATDGSPFAVAEVVRELARRGAVDGRAGAWRVGPEAVALAAELGRAGRSRALTRRVAQVPLAEAEVLGLRTLLAREAGAALLAAASGRDPRAVLAGLSALGASGLVRCGEQGWAPAHDLVGETVSGALSAAERTRLHGLLAAALESGGPDPAETARHHRAAGDARSAARASARAAARALGQHAAGEAEGLAGTGLAALDSGPGADLVVERAALLDLRAEARALRGDTEGAAEDLGAALRAGGRRSRRLARLAMLTSGARDLRRAAELAELAVVEAGTHRAERAFALETAAILDMNLDRADRAADRAAEALALYRRLGDAGGVARILDGRAMATFLEGRVGDGIALFERVAQLFEDSGELFRVITPRSTRGHGITMAGRPAEGAAEADRAVALARELGAVEGLAYALWHRGESRAEAGDAAGGLADAREALDLATAAGHRGWTATAHRAAGIALQAAGDLDAAAHEFARSAEIAGESLTLFASWAAARSALVAIASCAPAAARPLVERALATGPGLGHFEARLAEAELAAATGDPGAPALAARALELARAGGHGLHAARLAELAAAEDSGQVPGQALGQSEGGSGQGNGGVPTPASR